MFSRCRAGLIVVLALVPSFSRAEGPWTFTGTDPVGPATDFFYAVDAIEETDVWAVGTWEPPDTDRRALIQHFDGSRWTQLPTPSTGVPSPFESLTGVVALSANEAIAIGSYTPVGSTAQPLGMEWDGSEWSLLSTPEFSGGGTFQTIDRSPTGRVYVGGFVFGSAFVAERSGGSWEIEYAPQVSQFRNRFYGMHAFTDNEIWFVGTHGEDYGDFRILIQRYDGSGGWTTFDLPTPGWLDSLTGVHAAASDDVWATGYYYDTTLFLTQPLIMHYDGDRWTKVVLPAFSEGSAEFRGMTGKGAAEIYAAGTYATADGTPRAFMMEHDGSVWRVVDLPPTDGSGEWFRGMGVTSGGRFFAVGQYFDGTSTEPLAYLTSGAIASLEDEETLQPSWSALASPSPFRTETTLRFSLDAQSPVRVQLWDASGRLVRRLVDRPLHAGEHAIVWDGRDGKGSPVVAGVYLYDVEAGGRLDRGKVVRVR